MVDWRDFTSTIRSVFSENTHNCDIETQNMGNDGWSRQKNMKKCCGKTDESES